MFLLVPQHSITDLSTNSRQLQTGSEMGSKKVIELLLFTCLPKPIYCASDTASIFMKLVTINDGFHRAM